MHNYHHMKTKLIFALLLVSSLALQAQNDELKGFIRQSFNYSPRLQELTKANEISELRVNVAQSSYLPTVNGTASYTYLDPVGQATFPVSATETRVIQFQPNNNYNANIGLNQMLWDFGRTKAQVDKAKADLLASKQNTEASKAQLAAQITGIYYSIIYLKKAVSLQDSVIQFFQSNKKVIDGRVRQGDALKVDLLNVDNSISQEENRKLEFERQLQRQVALLKYATGSDDLPTKMEFDFKLGKQSTELTLESNADVLAADQKIASAQADSKLAQRGQLPNLSLQASAGFRNGYQPDINEIRFNYLAGVSLNVPIFQGKRLRQNILIAHKTVEAGEASKNNLMTSLQKDLVSAISDFEVYTRQRENASVQVEAAKEALRLTQVRYDRGVATYVDLAFASTNYQRSQLSELQLDYQGCLAQTEMARIAGVRFWE
jgi:outer membrane protein